MKKRILLFTAVPVLIVLALVVVFLMNRGKASSMHLVRTQGTVSVQDGEGEETPIRENLSLYDGHNVNTQTQSYAWIDLDKVKLTKMDESSDVTVHKNGKKLELVVNAGSLFFNVIEPLQDDESMEIRSSNMVVGIRGTCGWVELVRENCMRLYLLEGEVHCAVRNEAGEELVSKTVTPGQMAELVYDGENSSITVTEFSSIPDFVRTELDQMEQPQELSDLLAQLDANPAGPALEQYRSIIVQAASYQYEPYGDAVPTGNYRYALVKMQPDAQVPTLILEQETTELSYARLFQYDPATKTVLEPTENLTEGVAMTGGYRGGLSMMADGNGIRIAELSSGTGSMTIARATLEGSSVHTAVEYQGFMTDVLPEGLGSVEIPWHDVSDLTALDNWSAEAWPPESDEADSAASSGAGDTLPTDGDRLVLSGTIGTYSYEEVIELQGAPDPNAGPYTDTSQTFRLIVLDTPQMLSLNTVDNQLSEREAKMIAVDYAENLDGYEGQHLVFSIDPYNTYWPSEAAVPLGQPGTNDVHVLQ